MRATALKELRYDSYYPDYMIRHENLCEKQQQAYESQDRSKLIHYTHEKTKNLENYIHRGKRDIRLWHCDQLLKIIKNDQRMLKYLECEKVLEIRNHYAEEQKRSYQECLTGFENIKQHVDHIKNPSLQPRISNLDSMNIAQAEPSLKPQSNLDIDHF